MGTGNGIELLGAQRFDDWRWDIRTYRYHGWSRQLLAPGAIPVSSLPHCYDMHIHCVPQRYTAFHCAPVHARQCSRPASFLEPSLQIRSDRIIVWVKGMLDEVPPQSQLLGLCPPICRTLSVARWLLGLSFFTHSIVRRRGGRRNLLGGA